MIFRGNEITGLKSDYDGGRGGGQAGRCVCLYKGQVGCKIQGNKVFLEGVT